jgi:hypothetical protein
MSSSGLIGVALISTPNGASASQTALAIAAAGAFDAERIERSRQGGKAFAGSELFRLSDTRHLGRARELIGDTAGAATRLVAPAGWSPRRRENGTAPRLR